MILDEHLTSISDNILNNKIITLKKKPISEVGAISLEELNIIKTLILNRDKVDKKRDVIVGKFNNIDINNKIQCDYRCIQDIYTVLSEPKNSIIKSRFGLTQKIYERCYAANIDPAVMAGWGLVHGDIPKDDEWDEFGKYLNYYREVLRSVNKQDSRIFGFWKKILRASFHKSFVEAIEYLITENLVSMDDGGILVDRLNLINQNYEIYYARTCYLSLIMIIIGGINEEERVLLHNLLGSTGTVIDF